MFSVSGGVSLEFFVVSEDGADVLSLMRQLAARNGVLGGSPKPFPPGHLRGVFVSGQWRVWVKSRESRES